MKIELANYEYGSEDYTKSGSFGEVKFKITYTVDGEEIIECGKIKNDGTLMSVNKKGNTVHSRTVDVRFWNGDHKDDEHYNSHLKGHNLQHFIDRLIYCIRKEGKGAEELDTHYCRFGNNMLRYYEKKLAELKSNSKKAYVVERKIEILKNKGLGLNTRKGQVAWIDDNGFEKPSTINYWTGEFVRD